MTKENEKKLLKKYPQIFKNYYKSKNETCMYWGFDHDDGWFNLIDSICTKLKLIEKISGIKTVATQVKEKFGTLRFYYNQITENKKITKEQKIWSEIIDAVLNNAENESGNICEVCGEWGRLKSNNQWLKTLCSECSKKLNYIEV